LVCYFRQDELYFNEIGKSVRWTMAPFNNDWISSIFLSLDPVAIEPGGFDFLRAEFTIERGLTIYPQMERVDDYLPQAADSATWRETVDYDPEKDDTLLPSLGVHEHGNNLIDKQYSRNPGIGKGIELITTSPVTSIDDNKNIIQVAKQFICYPTYPNPFNPVTTIHYEITSPAHVELNMYNIQRQLMTTLMNIVRSAGEYIVSWNGIMKKVIRAPSIFMFIKYE
jgi:hypothetical protein